MATATKPRRLGKVVKKTSKYIEGYLKGNYIIIEKSKEYRGEGYSIYCTVLNPDGGYLVDGYFTDSTNINEALQWAIDGACI